MNGTTAEGESQAGQGPSWWMQLQTIDRLCFLAPALAAQATPPVVVETACKFCDPGLPTLTQIAQPGCASQLRFVPASERPIHLRVTPDAAGVFLAVNTVSTAPESSASAPAAPLLTADGSGPLLWLTADTLTNLVDGQTIARWPDQSGAGLDAVQADPEHQPRLALGTLNGHTAVRFDGVGDVLLTPPAVLNAQHTIVVVGQPQSTPPISNDVFWSYASSESASTLVELGVFHIRQDLRTLRVRYEGMDTFDSRPSSVLGEPSILVQRRDASGNVRAFVDGSLWLSSAEPTIDFSGPRAFRLGLHSNTGQYLDGEIAELRVYNRALSDDELANVTRDLGQRYAIGVQP